MQIDFEAELWTWDARPNETWTFVALPAEESDVILERAGGLSNGFGSLRVQAHVGGSSWKTSIFPDKARGAFVLPIKKAVRRAEGLAVGDTVDVTLELIEF
jgi:Domain of unknown function (DUF1905)